MLPPTRPAIITRPEEVKYYGKNFLKYKGVILSRKNELEI